jgi:dUTP pyrophosphatase
MNLNIKKLHPGAIVPTYASEGAACFDLYAIEDAFVGIGASAAVRTGLGVEVPAGWSLKIYSRSGHGFGRGVRLVNGVGVVDADYRGEMLVGLHNDGLTPFRVRAGDRIGQAMLERVERVLFTVVDEISETTRGASGFGSTGH